MPRRFSTRPTDTRRSSPSACRSETAPVPPPAERLRRWATLVAGGEAPLPADLEPEELSIVLAEVARLRRERLVRFVARAIAQAIHGEREP